MFLLGCSDSDNEGTDTEPTNGVKENTICFGDMEIPLTRAIVNIIGPFPGDAPRFYNYDIELFGSLNNVDYVFVMEVYPPESTGSDTEISLGSYRTHSNAVTEGGIEARIANGSTNEVFFITEGQITIERPESTRFIMRSLPLNFGSGTTGNLEFDGTVEVNDFTN